MRRRLGILLLAAGIPALAGGCGRGTTCCGSFENPCHPLEPCCAGYITVQPTPPASLTSAASGTPSRSPCQ